jgi:hypothetical protein
MTATLSAPTPSTQPRRGPKPELMRRRLAETCQLYGIAIPPQPEPKKETHPCPAP